jgi:chromosome segregation ATPase
MSLNIPEVNLQVNELQQTVNHLSHNLDTAREKIKLLCEALHETQKELGKTQNLAQEFQLIGEDLFDRAKEKEAENKKLKIKIKRKREEFSEQVKDLQQKMDCYQESAEKVKKLYQNREKRLKTQLLDQQENFAQELVNLRAENKCLREGYEN